MKNILKTFTTLLFALNMIPVIAATADDMQKDIDTLTAAFDAQMQNLEKSETTVSESYQSNTITMHGEDLINNLFEECQKFNGKLNQDLDCVCQDGSLATESNKCPEQPITCGNLGQKECNTNYKICEKDGQTKSCSGNMLPRNATKGHCVSAGRQGYKICTATKCDNEHELSGGHCNNLKKEEPKKDLKTDNAESESKKQLSKADKIKTLTTLCKEQNGKVEKEELDYVTIWCDVRGECGRSDHVIQKAAKAKNLPISFFYRCKDKTQGHCSTGHTCEMKYTE